MEEYRNIFLFDDSKNSGKTALAKFIISPHDYASVQWNRHGRVKLGRYKEFSKKRSIIVIPKMESNLESITPHIDVAKNVQSFHGIILVMEFGKSLEGNNFTQLNIHKEFVRRNLSLFYIVYTLSDKHVNLTDETINFYHQHVLSKISNIIDNTKYSEFIKCFAINPKPKLNDASSEISRNKLLRAIDNWPSYPTCDFNKYIRHIKN